MSEPAGAGRPPASPARRRALVRIAAAALIATLLALVGGPVLRRRAVEWYELRVTREAEAALRRALGPGVRVGSARLQGERELVLHDLEADAFDAPARVESLRVRELRLLVPEGESFRGRWTRLEHVEAVAPAIVVHLPQALPAAAPSSDTAAPPRVGTLIVKDARLTLVRERFQATLAVDAALREAGPALAGRIDVRAARVPLGLLAELLAGTTTLGAPSSLASAASGVADGEGSVDLAADGRVGVAARFAVPAAAWPEALAGDVRGDVELHAAASPPGASGARAWTAVLGVPGAGTAVVRGTHADATGLAWEQADVVVPSLPRAWLGDALPADVAWERASAVVHARPAPAGFGGDEGAVVLDALAKVESARVRSVALEPAQVDISGTLRPGGMRSGFDGEASVALGGRPQASLRGTLARDGAAGDAWSVDAGVRAWPGVLSRVAALAPGLPSGEWSDEGATLRVTGRLGPGLGGLRARGTLGPLAFRTRDAEVSLSSVRLALGGAEATASADGEIRVPALGVATVRAQARAPRARPQAWSLHGDLALGEGLGTGRASAEGDGAGGAAVHAELEGASLLAWLRALAPGVVREAGLEDAALTGHGTASLDGTWSGDAWSVRATGRVDGVAAQSDDFTRAVTIRSLRWDGDATGRAGELQATLRASASGTQVLRGSVFADLSHEAPEARATLARDATGAWSLEGTLTAGALGGLDLAATGGPVTDPADGSGATSVRLALACPSLGGAWASLARAGALEGVPAWASLRPEGHVRLEVEGTLSGGAADLSGEVRADGVALSDPAGRVAIENAAAALPLRLRREREGAPWTLHEPEAADAAGPSAGGARASRVEVLGASARDVALDLRIRDGSVVAEPGITLELLGGTLAVSRLALRDPLGHEPSLEAAAEARGLRLSELGPVGPFRLEGLVGARFPRVTLSSERLAVDGGARILAWGGEIDVKEVDVAGPLSRFPRTRVSATFSEIDLMELTRTFGFGAVGGVAEGAVDDLELFGATPVRFAARLETQPREGVAQSLSIPALQNLATLATGGRAPVFDKGLLKLVRTLRYEKLGLAATLQADAFVLRGLAERQGRELFLKGRLPLRVDVANAEPGAAVSFRAMMRRLAGLEGIGEEPSESEAPHAP